MSSHKELKDAIRRKVWDLLVAKKVATFPLPPHGRIPNFRGAEQAALLLAETPIWRKARIVKVNPDSPQRWVRLLALKQGKIVVMATPRLREGFLLLDPKKIPEHQYTAASTIRGAFRLGRRVSVDELKELGGIDLIVTGSVAVDKRGRRIGKGEGYAELEYAILRELGLAAEDTPIATTIHELQIVDEIPRDPYDLTLDLIVTPRRIIWVEGREPRPPGILWDLLPCSKFKEIPILAEIARMKRVAKPCKGG